MQREEIAALPFYDLEAVAEGFKATSPIWEAGALGSLLFVLIKHAPSAPQALEAREGVRGAVGPTPRWLVPGPRSWRLGQEPFTQGVRITVDFSERFKHYVYQANHHVKRDSGPPTSKC